MRVHLISVTVALVMGLAMPGDTRPDGAAAAPVAGAARGCDASGKWVRYEHGSRWGHRVALTFDDGPERNTEAILGVLARMRVQATFFPKASQIEGREDLLRREVKAGHVIGNHTFNHVRVDGAGPEAEREIDLATAAIRGATAGYTPCLFRAPSGADSPELLALVRAKEMVTISADVDPSDWRIDIGSDQIRDHVLEHVRPGSIVLLHEDYSSDSTLEALPGIIRGLRGMGYELVTVTDLLGIPIVTEGSRGVVRRFAGTGAAGYNGDGKPATTARLNFPIDVAPVPPGDGGGYLIADESNNRIRKVLPNGNIVTVAGTGAECRGIVPNSPADPCGDTHAATEARLNHPTGVAAIAGGGFLIADRGDNVVRKVDSRGIITTVAGTGDLCRPLNDRPCGDGGAATAARLAYPARAVPVGSGFLIAEDGGNRVRLVRSDGTIFTVAGSARGVPCPRPRKACGDGGAAVEALLRAPNGLAALAGGGFLVSDSGDNRIRKISRAGKITTIAGTGQAGSYGDGVPARQANLNSPSSVAVAPDGSIVVADTYSHIVRRVSRGVIRTIAGIADSPGDGAYGIKATRSRMDTPFAVTVTGNGDVLVADHLNHVIRRIDLDLA